MFSILVLLETSNQSYPLVVIYGGARANIKWAGLPEIQQIAEAHGVALMAERRREALDHELLFAHFFSFATGFAAAFSGQ
jgi:hypothetical protein